MRILGVLLLASAAFADTKSDRSCPQNLAVSSFESSGYPAIARSNAEQGDVVLRIRTNQSGSVIEAQMISGSSLLDAAKADVMHWHFIGADPFQELNVTFRYRLKGNPQNDHLRTAFILRNACLIEISTHPPVVAGPDVQPKRKSKPLSRSRAENSRP